MDIPKHKRIAIGLHILNCVWVVGLMFIASVMLNLFMSCSTTAIPLDADICHATIIYLYVIPGIVSLTPVIPLLIMGKVSRALLWIYSIVIMIGLFPVGTLVGWYTIYLLREVKKQEELS